MQPKRIADGADEVRQVCRNVVHKAVKADLMDRVLARVKLWRVGNQLDLMTNLGALIDAEHLNKVKGYLTKGALFGGKADGPFVPPTIYNAEPSEKLAREEVFGPVLSVIEVDSTDEAIAVANDTEYGLTASAFSATGGRAIRAAREIRAGTVTINCYREGDVTTPFGGYKQSGFGGRDNGIHAHEQYTELKTIWVNLSDPAAQDGLG